MKFSLKMLYNDNLNKEQDNKDNQIIENNDLRLTIDKDND